MPFKIMYKFMEEKKFYTCYVNYEQYVNFKELPIILECTIIKKNQQEFEDYTDEMQKAINLAAVNSTNHMRMLSEST